MTLVGRYGPGAAAPAPMPLSDVEEHELEELAVAVEEELEPETRDDVDEPAQAVEDERAAVRKMFAGLGWSTTAPAPVVDELEELEPAAVHAAIVDAVAVEVAPTPRVGSNTELPRNAVTGAYYRGKNVDRLLSAADAAGYAGAEWAGFRQWLSVGRVVRKGEHGTACVTVIADKATSSSSSEAPAAASSSGSRKSGKARGVRGFRVFHRDQTVEVGAEGPGVSIAVGELEDGSA